MSEYPNTHYLSMEDLYDSAIPGQLSINVKAHQEASRMIAEHHENARDYMDLDLVPQIMKDKDELLMTSPEDQRTIAKEVLAGLHEAWRGSEIMENPISETFTEKYWEFVDPDNDFMPWTVVEVHNSKPTGQEVGISAYMLAGPKRPADYQKLLNQKERELELAEEQAALQETVNVTVEDSPKHAGRRHKAAKSIGKWLKKQTNLPPRPNRFE